MRFLALLSLLSTLSWASRVLTAPQTSSVLPEAVAPEAAPIAIGQPLERRIRGGQADRFGFQAQAGDFIQVALEQQGLDVIAFIEDAAGQPLRRVSSRERRYGPELFYIVTPSDGLHHIEVRTAREDAPEGDYMVVLEAVRPATAEDLQILDLDAEWYRLINGIFGTAQGGNWDRALEMYTELMDRTEAFDLRDPKHRDFAVASVSLARALWNREIDRDKAISMLEDALSFMERTHGRGSYLFASVEAGLADVYLARNRNDEARALLDDALETMETVPDAEPASIALALVSMGRYYGRKNRPWEGVDALERGLQMILEERRSNLDVFLNFDQVVDGIRFSLGDMYLQAGDPDSAAPHIAATTSEAELRSMDPFLAIDRLSRASTFWLDLGDYEKVHDAVRRATAISDRLPVGGDQVRTLWARSAEAYLLTGDYPRAEDAYRRAIEFERSRPQPEQGQPGTVAPLLNYLAGAVVDQGRYRDANRVYREAFEEERAHPQRGTSGLIAIGENWAGMLRDLGMDADAAAISAWASGRGQDALPPFPEDSVIPERVAFDGVTLGELRRRFREPYRRDPSLTWSKMGLPRWSAPGTCASCFLQVLREEPASVLVRVASSQPDTGSHYLFLLHVGGTAELHAAGVLDLPGEREGAVRVLAAGTGLWLVATVATGMEWPHDFVETWFAITPEGFRPTPPYPEGTPNRDQVLTDLRGGLERPGWGTRRSSLQRMAATPGALDSRDVIGEIVGLLERENAELDDSLRRGESLLLANGNLYREYVAAIASLLLSDGDPGDPRTLTAIAGSHYPAESGFSRRLADRGGQTLVPVALELVDSDIPERRWNGLSLLARLYEQRDVHSLTAAQQTMIRQTIVDSTTHPEVSTRRLAVELLERIDAPED